MEPAAKAASVSFSSTRGTQTQTVTAYRRKGIDILSVNGTTAGAIELLISKMRRSSCLEGIESDEQAIDWLNELELGSAHYAEYTGMLAHCYTGWGIETSGWRKQKSSTTRASATPSTATTRAGGRRREVTFTARRCA